MWIPRGTQLARKVIRGCFRCKAQNHRTQTQIMAKLPEERLKVARPFQFTALDLFGPFKVKDRAKGRRLFKCWGAYTVVPSHQSSSPPCLPWL